jgi:hypothetical protein
VLLHLYLGSNEQQFQSVFHSYSVVAWPAIHQELYEMEEILTLSCLLVQRAALIHVYVLLFSYLFIKPIIKLPQHSLDFAFAHFHSHFFEHLPHLKFGEILVGIAC